LFFLPALVLAFLAFSASPALARAPWWKVTTQTLPAMLPESGSATIDVTAVNLGDGDTSGPITLSDTLPEGLSINEVEFYVYPFLGGGLNIGFICSHSARTVSCVYPQPFFEEHLPEISLHVDPYEYLEVRLKVSVESSIGQGEGTAEVKGGNAPEVAVGQSFVQGAGPQTFGVEKFEVLPEEEGGGLDPQAGSHPFQLSTKVAFKQGTSSFSPPALIRGLKVEMPPGLIGNAVTTPQCSDLDFRNLHEGGAVDFCQADTAIGVAVLTVDEPLNLGTKTISVPVFNLVPAKGEPARFGFEFVGAPVILDTSVRSGTDYGVDVSVSNTTELANVLSSDVVVWGVPGDPSHDESRGWGCLISGRWTPKTGITCEPGKESHPAPFLTLPTSCEESLTANVDDVVSWPKFNSVLETLETFSGAPESYSLKDEFGRPLGIVGCNGVPFTPELSVAPDTSSTSSPSGLAVRVSMPQEANETSQGIASSAIRNTSLTLPEGFELNAAAANGLEACSESQVGVAAGGSEEDVFFTPTSSPSCSSASKVGTVTLKSPDLPNPLKGGVFLAAQDQNPFQSLIAMYIVAEDPVSGVIVKLAGDVHLTETGQITTTLTDSPQAPIEEAEFDFFGGDQSALATPAKCGRYITRASFVSWSGGPAVEDSSTSEINKGPHGGPCPGQLPFSPGFEAAASNVQAGAFTPLQTVINREDGSQQIQAIQVKTPPGFSALITSTTPCQEPQADQGTCGAQSLIGDTSVSVGVGNQPYTVVGGHMYLTGPYEGAPFGLSIVVPAKAGPFDLGVVVVRAKVEIDRQTAQATITTDSTGPYAIPHFLKGIPVEIRKVTASIDRTGFAFNPTSCDQFAITGALTSNEGASVPVSSPFEVANCAKLAFAPKITASTAGKASKANGASLDVKVGYPTGPEGTYANIKAVKVDLPKQLPSRLTTLQKACLAATFEANPASCPKASNVGTATATTPVLKAPLIGPAYLVSHGGEAFPDLEIVLQGENNITLILIGNTQIKHGITSSTFKAVPDAPVSSFELKLPTGQFSILGANVPQGKKYNLCGQSLPMPTQITAQNGAVIKQTTKIAVSGCPRVKKSKKSRHKAKKREKVKKG
jgi:hypothetical protein